MRIVAKECDVPYGAVLLPPDGSPSHQRRLYDARAICHVLMHSILGMSDQAIADAFYKKDGRTVMDVIDRAMKRVGKNEKFRDAMTRCTTLVRDVM